MADIATKGGKTAKQDNAPPKQEDGYKIVAVAVDLTGKSMLDEIFHLSAYTIKNDKPMSFTQHIMPHRDVNLAGQRKHGVRVYNSYGVYRILCDMRSGRILRTKSEYSTLNSFIKWLSTVKEGSQGVILVHHGNVVDNMMPFLLQALDRYKMTDAFYEIVHGCVDCKTIVAGLPEMKDRSLSMQSLLRRVLEFTDDKMKPNVLGLGSAKNRAPLTYKIAMKILKMSDTSDVTTGSLDSCINKEQEREILVAQRLKSDKVRSLRPIFVQRRGTTRKERTHVATLRKYLIDMGVNYETLKTAYTNSAKEGVAKILEDANATTKKKQDIEELIGLIVDHFEKPEGATDINANIPQKGQGEAGKAGASADDEDDEDDEEFQEAQGEK